MLASLVLVYYFISYLDLKPLLDNLNVKKNVLNLYLLNRSNKFFSKYLLSRIILPVINLYSNEKTKFPNGYAMRQVLSYKVLDIVLMISLRLGPEQTRLEMEKTLKAFFNGFSLVRSSVMNTSSLLTRPLFIERMRGNGQEIGTQSKNSLAKGAFKARASIASFNYQRQFSSSKDNILLNNSGGSVSLLEKENLSDEMNSFDEYLKYSYDQNTNEIIGSSLKTKRLSLASSTETYKNRSQSFGLLSLNNEGFCF